MCVQGVVLLDVQLAANWWSLLDASSLMRPRQAETTQAKSSRGQNLAAGIWLGMFSVIFVVNQGKPLNPSLLVLVSVWSPTHGTTQFSTPVVPLFAGLTP